MNTSDLIGIPEFVERQLQQQAQASPLPYRFRQYGRLCEIVSVRRRVDPLVASALLPEDAAYLVDAANHYPDVLLALRAERERARTAKEKIERLRREVGVLMASIIVIVIVFTVCTSMLLSYLG